LRFDHRAALAIISLAASACGLGTGPSSTDVPLEPGLYELSLYGADLSNDPLSPPCPPFGVPYDGKMVKVKVRLDPDGKGRRGRSLQTDDTLSFLLSGSRGDLPTVTAVTGSIQGSAWDEAHHIPARDVRVSVKGSAGSASASLVGEIEYGGFFGHGHISGDVVFNSRDGSSSSCTGIVWAITHWIEP